MAQNDTPFKWNEQRLSVAKGLSMGMYSEEEVAKFNDISRRQIQRWKQHPDFTQKVNEFTLAHDFATKAGLLREAYHGLGIKRKRIDGDKTSHLDYMKEIADLQAMKKQQIEHSGVVSTVDVMTLSNPDIMEAADELAKRISESRSVRSSD